MKKRRDLDALVNGKLGGRRKKNGQHELLRNTDSSDIEEFAIPPQNLARKHRSASRFCSTCLAVCGFFLLTACAVAVAGLVWVHIELKRDVDTLQMRLRSVESSSSGNTNVVQEMHTKMEKFENDIQMLQDKSNLFQLNISSILETINRIQKSTSQPSSKAIEDVKAVKQQVASMGSELETLKDSTKNLENMQKLINSNLEEVTPSQPDARSNPEFISVKNELLGLQQNISNMNTSMIHNMASAKLQRELAEGHLNASFLQLEDRVALLEMRPISEGSLDKDNMQNTIQQAVQDAMNAAEPATSSRITDIERLVNNITLDMDDVKRDSQRFNFSIFSSQQSYVQLAERVKDHETRLSTLEKHTTAPSQVPFRNSPTYSGAPPPPPSRPVPDLTPEKESTLKPSETASPSDTANSSPPGVTNNVRINNTVTTPATKNHTLT